MNLPQSVLDQIAAAESEGRVTEYGPLAVVMPPREDASEEDFQRRVKRLAERRGWLCYHTHDSRRSQAGFPDLVTVRGPRVVYAELKSATGRLRKEQAVWLAALLRAGAEAYVWRPSDWAEVEEVLK